MTFHRRVYTAYDVNKMSVVISQSGETKLTLKPCLFRRIHNLEDGKLVYSHSECICKLENNQPVHVELVEAVLTTGDYIIKILPTDLTFPLQFTGGEKEPLQWLKKLIFINFPNLSVQDVYLNEKIPVD